MEDIRLHFSGPFSFFKGSLSLFHSYYANCEGIYIWVIKNHIDKLNYIHYIGETKEFARRHREHITHILGLNYRILDPDAARQGVEKIIWDGMWRDKTENAVSNALENYNSTCKYVIEYVKAIDVYFAPTSMETQTRRHIEGYIGWNLRNQHSEHKVFYPDDNHVGTKSEKLGINLVITCDQDILGLDHKIMV